MIKQFISNLFLGRPDKPHLNLVTYAFLGGVNFLAALMGIAAFNPLAILSLLVTLWCFKRTREIAQEIEDSNCDWPKDD